MIWNKDAECMLVKERQALQLERLKSTVARVFYQVPYSIPDSPCTPSENPKDYPRIYLSVRPFFHPG